MKRFQCVVAVLALLAGLPGIAAAQIDSHCLPPEMPMALFPSWVSTLPAVECREVSAPVLQDHIESRKVVVEDARATLGLPPLQEGTPDATRLSDMCKEPRQAIRLAESGKYAEAARAGEALLGLPRERYGDFTWDYLANATAWACIQTGNRTGAVQAHNAVTSRIQDTAVARYHGIAASTLHETTKSARQLKDYATYQGEIRKNIEDAVKNFTLNSALAQKARSAEARLRYLTAAYNNLRLVTAADPDTGKRLQRTTFREAADGLVGDIAPVLLDEAREARDRLVAVYPQMLPGRKFHQWNTDVRILWDKVQHVKRLCRMHDYLARVKLASPGDADARFREAHRLLFAPDDRNLVWQEMGHRPVHFKDYRRKVPYEQTLIRPM
ncbi:MAG: hypothetical protein AMS14_02150 [Planctomycetes bacterium DG_20]|nr:MAG: hypothetical protein AMS14_02150 [Planctomycetes bacterium DG_20]